MKVTAMAMASTTRVMTIAMGGARLGREYGRSAEEAGWRLEIKRREWVEGGECRHRRRCEQQEEDEECAAAEAGCARRGGLALAIVRLLAAAAAATDERRLLL